jgi:hypothetical protein
MRFKWKVSNGQRIMFWEDSDLVAGYTILGLIYDSK